MLDYHPARTWLYDNVRTAMANARWAKVEAPELVAIFVREARAANRVLRWALRCQ